MPAARALHLSLAKAERNEEEDGNANGKGRALPVTVLHSKKVLGALVLRVLRAKTADQSRS